VPALRRQASARVAYAVGIDNGGNGAPDWIRTSDLQLRRLPLYPSELRARRIDLRADFTRFATAVPGALVEIRAPTANRLDLA
jgi:hypothetical protein